MAVPILSGNFSYYPEFCILVLEKRNGQEVEWPLAAHIALGQFHKMAQFSAPIFQMHIGYHVSLGKQYISLPQHTNNDQDIIL